MIAFYRWRVVLLSISIILLHFQLLAQDSAQTATDSVQPASEKNRSMDSASLSKAVDSVRRKGSRNDTALMHQLKLMEDYAGRLGQMAAYFRQGIDTAAIRADIDQMESQLALARQGVTGNLRNPNMRNLVSTRILLWELEKLLQRRQEELNNTNSHVSKMRNLLDSMKRDSSFRSIPSDSVLAQQWVGRVMDLVKRFRPIDSLVREATIDIGILQSRIVRNVLDVNDQLSLVEQQIASIRSNYFSRDEPPIWASRPRNKSTSEIVALSYKKSKLVLSYYLKGTAGITAVWLVFFVLLWLGLRYMVHQLQRQHKEFMLQHIAPHLSRSVLLASLFLSVALSQMMYANVPMVFLQSAWLIMLLSATILVWPDLQRFQRRLWLLVCILFLWACFENLILENGALERWGILMASLIGLLLAAYLMRLHGEAVKRIKNFQFFLYLFIAQEVIALLANTIGFYTFGRAMAVGGYFNFVLGVLFFHGIVLVKEMVMVTYEYFRRKDKISSVVNLLQLKQQLEGVLPVVAWAGWLIIFAKNLNFYDVVLDGATSFLTDSRRLGNIDFTFGSVAVFFITIWVSTILAKAVTFLLGGNSGPVSNIQKTRFGNSILVLKLGIISMGILVAFAASGIPLDKITIIIGALGVGIGFGLQNIVNNLVSGVILAFEKPVEIGDQIEVGGRLGKIKEIGIRSSKLATFDGSEVIIPNGDLLSQHVVNWTLSNNHRRVEIIVGVQYGTRLKLVQQLLEGVLQQNEKIDKSPAPLVLLHQFNNSSVDFRLLFWTDISQWVELKSEIIIAIDDCFAKEGIVIPFPQMVVHIADKQGEKAKPEPK